MKVLKEKRKRGWKTPGLKLRRMKRLRRKKKRKVAQAKVKKEEPKSKPKKEEAKPKKQESEGEWIEEKRVEIEREEMKREPAERPIPKEKQGEVVEFSRKPKIGVEPPRDLAPAAPSVRRLARELGI